MIKDGWLYVTARIGGVINVGDEIPQLKKNCSTQQLVLWAAGSGDFYQIHYDKDFAIGTGLKGIIVHGALKQRLVAEALKLFYEIRDYPDRPVHLELAEVERPVEVVESVMPLVLDRPSYRKGSILERITDDMNRTIWQPQMEGGKAETAALLNNIGGIYQARQEIEQMLGQKVFLQLHVKVREGWRQDPRTLKELEYSE